MIKRTQKLLIVTSAVFSMSAMAETQVGRIDTNVTQKTDPNRQELAIIAVDGKFTSQFPSFVELEPGKHRLTLALSANGEPVKGAKRYARDYRRSKTAAMYRSSSVNTMNDQQKDSRQLMAEMQNPTRDVPMGSHNFVEIDMQYAQTFEFEVKPCVTYKVAAIYDNQIEHAKNWNLELQEISMASCSAG